MAKVKVYDDGNHLSGFSEYAPNSGGGDESAIPIYRYEVDYQGTTDESTLDYETACEIVDKIRKGAICICNIANFGVESVMDCNYVIQLFDGNPTNPDISQISFELETMIKGERLSLYAV